MRCHHRRGGGSVAEEEAVVSYVGGVGVVVRWSLATWGGRREWESRSSTVAWEKERDLGRGSVAAALERKGNLIVFPFIFYGSYRLGRVWQQVL